MNHAPPVPRRAPRALNHPALPWILALGLMLAWAACLWSAPVHAQQEMAVEDLSAFPKAHLVISSGTAVHEFDIWVANTPERQEQGLMFVRELPAKQGMVFDDGRQRTWSMWMKNTFIPLDMLFIAPDGHITQIAHAIPHDESIIRSTQPVEAVVELQGGITDKLHIKVGDQTNWKLLP